MEKKSVTINFRLERFTNDNMEKLCRELGVTRSQFIRAAVRRMVHSYDVCEDE